MYSAASSGATLCLVTVGGPAGGEEHVKSRASEAVKPGKALHSQVCNGVCLLTMDQDVDVTRPSYNECTITARISEVTTLRLEGNYLNNISYTELTAECERSGVRCKYPGANVIIIEGTWDLVQQARQKIHNKILEVGRNQATRQQPARQHSISNMYGDSAASSQYGGNTSSQYGGSTFSQYGGSTSSQYEASTYAPQHGGTSVYHQGLSTYQEDMHGQQTSNATSQPIASNFEKRKISDSTTPTPRISTGSSHYDMIPNLSLDIVQLMKHKRLGFRPGIEFKEKTNDDDANVTVHFYFSAAPELDRAIKNFESEYEKLNRANVATKIVPIPRGIHQEQLGTVVSEMETAYEKTMINWRPENLELKIVSPHCKEIEEQLRQRLEELKLPTQSFSSKKQRNPKAVVKNLFSSHKEMNQCIKYQPEIVLCFIKGRTITVRNGNLLDEPTDAIVNPCNGHLSHGGGLAKQIDDASGGVLSRQCNAYMRQYHHHDRVPTGEVVTVEAGRVGHLKCKYIINAVGPNLHEIKDHEKCKELLKLAMENIIREGVKRQFSSIAIPAISSGLFGMDKDVVAEVIVDSLVTYQKNQRHSYGNLCDIRIVVWDKETYFPFLAYASTIEQSLILV